MPTESNLDTPRPGTKSYRGRSLDEILPQIRAELGADAVILREREGLVGGVGGFFAQRFVEVEARRGDGQSIDVYDDGPDFGTSAPAPAGLPSLGLEPARGFPHDLDAITVHRQPAESAPSNGRPAADALRTAEPQPPASALRPHEPRPFIPPSISVPREPAPQPGHVVEREPRPQPAHVVEPTPAPASGPAPAPSVAPKPEWAPAPSSASPGPVRAPEPTPKPTPKPTPTARRFETGIFMERLREASAMLPSPDPQPESYAPQPDRYEPQPDHYAPQPETYAPQPDRYGPQPETGRDPLLDLAADIGASEAIAAMRRANGGRAPERTAAQPTAAERTAPSRPGAQASPSRPAPSRPAPSRSGPSRSGPSRPGPSRTSAARPGPTRPAPPKRNAPPPPAPRTPPPPRPASLRAPVAQPSTELTAQDGASPTGARRLGADAIHPLAERRITLGRLFGRRRGVVLKPAPPQPLDTAAAGRLTSDLLSRGASQAWTSQLIQVAAAHGNPLADGLRSAAGTELARRIVPAPPLPAGGAAIAFIGAGGSGKTRCTAALASAYRRGSTLPVTVIALDNPDGARELSKLLKPEGVPVLALSGDQAKQAIDLGRRGGVVIVDTPTATPTDPTEIEVLSSRLAPLALDATYVTLPATLSATVAKSALASFGKLHPAAVTITHADETDQLAGLVEIAIQNRIPLAYFHTGTDHRSALSTVDAAAVARELLP